MRCLGLMGASGRSVYMTTGLITYIYGSFWTCLVMCGRFCANTLTTRYLGYCIHRWPLWFVIALWQIQIVCDAFSVCFLCNHGGIFSCMQQKGFAICKPLFKTPLHTELVSHVTMSAKKTQKLKFLSKQNQNERKLKIKGSKSKLQIWKRSALKNREHALLCPLPLANDVNSCCIPHLSFPTFILIFF